MTLLGAHASSVLLDYWSGSVSRILFSRNNPRSTREHPKSDGHSSRRRIAPLAQATYPRTQPPWPGGRSRPDGGIGRAALMTPPYLVLHRGEFA